MEKNSPSKVNSQALTKAHLIFNGQDAVGMFTEFLHSQHTVIWRRDDIILTRWIN